MGRRQHLFVFRGDLTQLACDAWLLPTDGAKVIVSAWVHAGSRLSREVVKTLGGFKPRRLPSAENPGRIVRWLDPHGEGPGADGAVYLLDVGGGRDVSLAWYLDGVRSFLDAVTDDVRSGKIRAAGRRARPLVGLPVIGTGGGGAASRKGEIIKAIIRVLLAHRPGPGGAFDVALVTYGPRSYAAAQAARRHLEQEGADLWPELRDKRAAAERLAADATAGNLVLFLGSGVSVGAGLPTWDELLTKLAVEFRFPLTDDLDSLSPLDKARLIESRAPDRLTFREAVANATRSRHHSLQHGLLASLPCREVITTNYDDLFEIAWRAASRDEPLAVLPAKPARNVSRWVLKLHGCVNRPEDIVLTRADYFRYANQRAALAGIVQASLMTRHMLFVGFSLNDDNFLKIVDDVQIAMDPSGGLGSQIGTTLLIEPNPNLAHLWGSEMNIVDMLSVEESIAHSDRTTRLALGARRLEIFLDYLAFLATTSASHLLDPDFSGVLTEAERKLSAVLSTLAAYGDESDLPRAWSLIEAMLKRLGLPTDESP